MQEVCGMAGECRGRGGGTGDVRCGTGVPEGDAGVEGDAEGLWGGAGWMGGQGMSGRRPERDAVRDAGGDAGTRGHLGMQG